MPRHLFVNARNNRWVCEQVAAALEGHGLRVALQGQYRNVVALPPVTVERRLTFVAAHYDSVPGCPGADDNASGLAVLLECARLLAQANPRPLVGFIAFNAEEDGLLGSRDFVTNGLSALRCPVRSAHVLEMVGFRSGASQTQHLPFPWVPANLKVPDFISLLGTGRSSAVLDSAVTSSVSPELRVLAAKTWRPLRRLLPDLTRSDHFPFWNAGVPAVLWTDTGNFRNPHYHLASDTPDTLDYAFMREVAEHLCEVVSKEANQ